jgi:hypothetical protein
MVGPGGMTTTTSDGSGAVHIVRASKDGKVLQEDVWSSQRLVMETGLTSRLGDAIPESASPETAAKTASKVQGEYVTYYALDKSPVPMDASLSRLLRSGINLSGTNRPIAQGDIRGVMEAEAKQRRLDALSRTPEEQVRRARAKQEAQSSQPQN